MRLGFCKAAFCLVPCDEEWTVLPCQKLDPVLLLPCEVLVWVQWLGRSSFKGRNMFAFSHASRELELGLDARLYLGLRCPLLMFTNCFFPDFPAVVFSAFSMLTILMLAAHLPVAAPLSFSGPLPSTGHPPPIHLCRLLGSGSTACLQKLNYDHQRFPFSGAIIKKRAIGLELTSLFPDIINSPVDIFIGPIFSVFL